MVVPQKLLMYPSFQKYNLMKLITDLLAFFLSYIETYENRMHTSFDVILSKY